MPKQSEKLSRREANHQSLQEWVKKKKIPRKFMFDVTALLTLYETGNIHNVNTVKNDINRLISIQKPETFYRRD
jgi:predicted S18 family serine protease